MQLIDDALKALDAPARGHEPGPGTFDPFFSVAVRAEKKRDTVLDLRQHYGYVKLLLNTVQSLAKTIPEQNSIRIPLALNGLDTFRDLR